MADGPFAAHWAAQRTSSEGSVLIVEDDAAFLAEIDIAAVGVDELVATFNWLGIHTLGALAQLPRPAIASRFGSPGLHAHRLASGEDRSPRPRVIPLDLAVEDRYEEPLQLLEQVGFAARALAGRLIDDLTPNGVAPHRVHVEAEAADGTVRSRVWRSADPFSASSLSERVWWQLAGLDRICGSTGWAHPSTSGA